MSPSIRVDEEVYAFLQGNAQPFVDTPNSVLRRLLKLGDSQPEAAANQGERPGTPRRSKPRAKSARPRATRRSQRARPGSILPHDAYVLPILEAIQESGGTAPTRNVIESVGRKLERDLTSVDREPLPSGTVRWENRAQFVRLRMVEEGLLAGDSPRGVWTITAAGRSRVTGEV